MSRLLVGLACGVSAAAGAFILYRFLAPDRPQRRLEGVGGKKGFTTYYRNAGSLREVIRRWRQDDEKLYDDEMPLTFSPKELWRYREYTRTRSTGMRTPEEWDELVDSMRGGWKKDDPLILHVGKKGGVKVGEGNHRLAIAMAKGLKRVPVRVLFYDGKVTKTKMFVKELTTPKPEPKPLPRRTRPMTPADEALIDEVMDLLKL
jgi:hypothetical protein